MKYDDEYIFDDYFDTINLNDELEKFYQLIVDEDLNQSFAEESKLADIRNDNYKRYNELDLSKIENLPEYLVDVVSEIQKIYKYIPSKRLLDSNMEESIEYKKILDSIYNHLNQLTSIVQNELNQLERQNNKRQLNIKKIDYEKIDRKTIEKVLNKYNYVVIYNSVLENNVFDNYKKQLQRKKYIDELYKMLNLGVDNLNNTVSEIKKLNQEIGKEIRIIYDKIAYIEDLIFEKSKYKQEFSVFKDYFSNLIAYDDKNYTETYRVYNLLCKDLKIKSVLNYFEDSIVEEIEEMQREEKFIYERQGIRNIRISLDYISANYMDVLSEEEKQDINLLYNEIDSEDVKIDDLYNKLNRLVVNIWKNSITNVKDYNETEDFNFICTNNEFIDERHQSILITKKMLERVMDYSNYQIGFICNYNENILYVTENDDIMAIEYNDMSNLKTPKQIEQEFLNFKICNRIALNGYITRMSAVYFIDDGDSVKHNKAIELAKQHDLPLIILKKDKN